MVKVKDYGILIFFLLGVFFATCLPRTEAQYPDRWIQSIQNSSPLQKSNPYIHLNTNFWAQTIIDPYYLNTTWTDSILWGSNTTNLFDTYSFSQTNQKLRLQDSSLSFNNYDPLNINSLNQSNNYPYYLQPIFENSILQGLNTGILQNTTGFFPLQQNILP